MLYGFRLRAYEASSRGLRHWKFSVEGVTNEDPDYIQEVASKLVMQPAVPTILGAIAKGRMRMARVEVRLFQRHHQAAKNRFIGLFQNSRQDASLTLRSLPTCEGQPCLPKSRLEASSKSHLRSLHTPR